MKHIKRTLYIILLLALYELSKYVTNEILIKLLIKLQDNEIDQPKDYEEEK